MSHTFLKGPFSFGCKFWKWANPFANGWWIVFIFAGTKILWFLNKTPAMFRKNVSLLCRKLFEWNIPSLGHICLENATIPNDSSDVRMNALKGKKPCHWCMILHPWHIITAKKSFASAPSWFISSLHFVGPQPPTMWKNSQGCYKKPSLKVIVALRRRRRGLELKYASGYDEVRTRALFFSR